MTPQQLIVKASQSGLELITTGDRAEARQGRKVVAWAATPERALEKALERLEEDRLRRLDPLPSDREPVLVARPLVAVPTASPSRRPRRAIPIRVPADASPTPIVVASETPAVDTAPDTPRVIKGSIIKTKYKQQYKANGGNCGDTVAEELAEYVTVVENKRPRLDLDRLRQVAKDNGLWKDSYSALNPGQMRMTVGNRLRVKYQSGAQIVIGGAPFQMTFEEK